MTYNVLNTTDQDLEFIFYLFEQAILYQKRNNYAVWNGYDKDTLRKDVKEGLSYKIVSNNEILCIFSVCYSDHIIWREKECGNAIYIHRMVVNPKYKGQKQFGKVLKWALKESDKRNLDFIRMDTWANNPKIIEYYKNYVFEFIEYFTTPNTIDLPIQHRNLELALLQFTKTLL